MARLGARTRALIAAIVAMQANGHDREARDGYGEVVRRHQRRATRIACKYLRNEADADEAVQDAFVVAYAHLSSFRCDLSFQAWFTRILINRRLDRLTPRRRRRRWVGAVPEPQVGQPGFWDSLASAGASPEQRILAKERRRTLADALLRLPRNV